MTFVAESELAKLCFKTWVELGDGRSVQGVRTVLKRAPSIKTPKLNTIRQWKSRYRWDDRLEAIKKGEPIDIYVDLDDASTSVDLPPANFNIVVKHRGDYDVFTYCAGNLAAEGIVEFAEKIKDAASKLVIPDEVSIAEYKKIMETFKLHVDTAQALHNLHLDVEGINVLIEERLK